jgi:hypothetical protein
MRLSSRSGLAVAITKKSIMRSVSSSIIIIIIIIIIASSGGFYN